MSRASRPLLDRDLAVFAAVRLLGLGGAVPTRRAIAATTGIPLGSVQRSLLRLADVGLLRLRFSRRGGATIARGL